VKDESKETLDRCVKRIAASEDLPAFAHHIYELMTTAADEDASVRRLTNTILKNISLTTKLLRLVNTVYFNRSNMTILSVSHAVIMVGWDVISNLASSLLLFEQFNKKSPGVKELMLLSLLTAHHARQVSVSARYPRPEEAYLCGMFSFLGELLVSCYLPEEYEQILRAIKNNEPEADACQRILGFSYVDLGNAMVQQWQLPEKITTGMGKFSQLRGRTGGEEGLLRAISVFSRSLTETVYRHEAEASSKNVKTLIQKFSDALPLKEENVEEILKAAIVETREAFSAANIPFDNLRLVKSIEIALDEPMAAEELVDAKPPVPATGGKALASLTREVELVLMSGEVFDLQDIIMMILEAIYRGGAFDRVLFCMNDEDHSNVSARMGLGEGVETLIAEFNFPISLLSGPIGPVMIAKKDVFIDQVSESRYEKSGFVEVVGASSFGICPLVNKGNAVGCLYFDRLSSPLGLDEPQKKLLLTLRTHLQNLLAVKSKDI
jgi:HD-like signal output (HDOD) protein